MTFERAEDRANAEQERARFEWSQTRQDMIQPINFDFNPSEDEDELELEALTLPQLTLTRTSGFNTFDYSPVDQMPAMEFIGTGSGLFASELEKEVI